MGNFRPTMTPELSVLAHLLELWDAHHNQYCVCGEWPGNTPCAICCSRVQLGIKPKHYICSASYPALSMFDGLVDRSKIPVCDRCEKRVTEVDDRYGHCRSCVEVADDRAGERHMERGF